MSMRLVEWLPQARAALWEILDYLGDRNPYAAKDLYDSIEKTAEGLAQNPYMYRPGRVAGTREAVIHPNYILVYRVTIKFISLMFSTPAWNILARNGGPVHGVTTRLAKPVPYSHRISRSCHSLPASCQVLST